MPSNGFTKRIYILSGLLIIVILSALFLIYSAQPTPSKSANTNNNTKTVTFFCADNKSIVASFYPDNDTQVDLRLSDGRVLSVPHALSASGARYARADESFVFWNKGNTAFITENGTSTYIDCALPDSN